MQVNVNKEIVSLRRMTAGELRQRHLELFGEPSRSSNRQWLFRRLAWRIQALAEGGLSQRARRRAGELVREVDIRVRSPKELSMPPATGIPLAMGRIPIRPDDRLPMPGTVLTRKFKGHEYQVTVLPNGFECDGEVYRSLSAVAHAITGSHWNGYHFFGILKKAQ